MACFRTGHPVNTNRRLTFHIPKQKAGCCCWGETESYHRRGAADPQIGLKLHAAEGDSSQVGNFGTSSAELITALMRDGEMCKFRSAMRHLFGGARA